MRKNIIFSSSRLPVLGVGVCVAPSLYSLFRVTALVLLYGVKHIVLYRSWKIILTSTDGYELSSPLGYEDLYFYLR